MKKLYTIALAAAVALSASAQQKLQTSNQVSGPAKVVSARILAKNATIERAGKFERNATPSVKHAPAKAAAATTMDELTGMYRYSINAYVQGTTQQVGSTLNIEEGTEPNEVILKGLRYSDVNVKGIVDFAAGTITCKPQLLEEVEDDPEYPGVSMDMWLYGWDEANDTEDRNGDCVININADGTLSSDDLFCYGVEGLEGYAYAWFDNLEMTKLDFNTVVYFSERDTDDDGYYLDTYTEYMSWCSSEYAEGYTLGGEDLGDCVLLNSFMFQPNSLITSVNTIPVQLDPDAQEMFIDTWYWFNYDLTALGGDATGSAAIIGVNGTKIDIIEGTYSGNTITWEGDWGAYSSTHGWFGWYKDCEIVLPFNLTDDLGGLNEVAVDNNENAPVEYFNLQGVRINEPAAGQIVIRRQGNKTTKLFVK
ncbi:MAG: hypothetical protein HDS30_02290 [Bacteroides sp.]|nr:hypothetical protein [Bacteroides sp.]